MGEEEMVNQQAADAQKIKEECDANLADVMATLNEAVATLNTVTPNDITVIKAMKTPPPKGIRLLMEAICMLKVKYMHVHYLSNEYRALCYPLSIGTRKMPLEMNPLSEEFPATDFHSYYSVV